MKSEHCEVSIELYLKHVGEEWLILLYKERFPMIADVKDPNKTIQYSESFVFPLLQSFQFFVF